MQWSCRFYYIDAPQGRWLSEEKKARRELHKNTASHNEQILEATALNEATVRLPTTHL